MYAESIFWALHRTQPRFQDFGAHRLPTVLDEVRKTPHKGVTQFEEAVNPEEDEMMDEDLVMTQEETPVVDGFSKMPLVNAFQA